MKAKYTQEQIDYVIDELDLGFMRNRIHRSKAEQDWMFNSYAGRLALLSLAIKDLSVSVLKAWRLR